MSDICARGAGGGKSLNYQVVPDHLAQSVRERIEVDGEFTGLNGSACQRVLDRGRLVRSASLGALTIEVVLDERVIRLVVVDQLDHLKQILFLQLDQGIGHFLDIERLLSLLAAAIDLARLAVLVARQRTSLTQKLLQALGGVLEGYSVSLLVAVLLEVEIVGDGDLAALIGVVEVNVHLKLAPSFVLTGEGRVGESFGTVSIAIVKIANGQKEGNLLCTGLAKEGWRLKTTLVKQSALWSLPA